MLQQECAARLYPFSVKVWPPGSPHQCITKDVSPGREATWSFLSNASHFCRRIPGGIEDWGRPGQRFHRWLSPSLAWIPSKTAGLTCLQLCISCCHQNRVKVSVTPSNKDATMIMLLQIARRAVTTSCGCTLGSLLQSLLPLRPMSARYRHTPLLCFTTPLCALSASYM